MKIPDKSNNEPPKKIHSAIDAKCLRIEGAKDSPFWFSTAIEPLLLKTILKSVIVNHLKKHEEDFNNISKK